MIIVVMLKLCIRNSNNNKNNIIGNSNSNSSINNIKRNFMKITIKCKHIFRIQMRWMFNSLCNTIVWLNINCLTLIENILVLSLFRGRLLKNMYIMHTTLLYIIVVSFMQRIYRGCWISRIFINNNNDWQLWWWQFFQFFYVMAFIQIYSFT